MRTIIHDLENLEFLKLKCDDFVIDNKFNKSCVGCFSCWVKHPMECVFNDSLKYNGKKILESDTLIVISKCVCGCYSSIVKRILERSLSYVDAFFTIRNGMIHHKSRLKNKIEFKVIFYGETMLNERKIASKLVNLNMNNLNCKIPDIHFINDINQIKEII